MKYAHYTPNSIAISKIGLGAWQLGKDSGWKHEMTESEAINMVHKALDLGINFFDTAPNYGYGSSEIRLGKALKDVDRDRIVINTKFGHGANGETNFEADQIISSIEGSLKRMNLDFLDSVIIHNPPIEYLNGNTAPQYHVLEHLKKQGKIKAYGASLDTFDEMKLLMETTKTQVIEAFFNIFHQDAARAFKMAKEKDVAIIVKIPLDSGWLSGKYSAESSFTDIRNRWSKADIQTRALLVDKVKALLPTSFSLAQNALAFCLSYDAVSTVIPGNATIQQLESNVASIDCELPDDLVAELEYFYDTEVRDLHLPW